MAVDSLGTQLRLLLAHLDGDVQSVYDQIGTPFRPRFFPIVRQLLETDAESVGALARAAGVTQPAATQTITELTKLGLVVRTPSADGREKRIGLTAEGRALTVTLQPAWQAVAEAAHELEAQLPCPLSEVLGAALEALNRESFRHRIFRKLTP